ncbi:MAG: 3-oxoacyl-ACP synthase III [Planctomycetaceae bacterium]|jgi:3-oxoacyl-[acyl-carrier-protein] synthase-3|nr:3-oxoacyl-ACP synthase III [Planctomycetaceae bacterium]
MIYNKVCVEGFGYSFPPEIVSTSDIEVRLSSLYERLKLPYGRLELMTGIRERRLFPADMLPGDESVRTAERLIDAVGIRREKIGTLIHASVCSDYAEPATACSVHHRLKLPTNCEVYDVSNACLGILNGMIQIANRIELGQIDAGIVVGTEVSRSLMETTIASLNSDMQLDRRSVKPAFASLTIGSGSAAVLLVNERLSKTGNRLLGGAVSANTEHCELCMSATDPLGRGGGTLMQTDSEELMLRGVEAAAVTFERFLNEVNWQRESINRFFSHQVGKKHRQLLCEALQLNEKHNFTTLEYLGNTGSCALPTAAAVGFETGFVADKSNVALLGIGSGINVLMLALDWQRTLPITTLPQDADTIRKIIEVNGM